MILHFSLQLFHFKHYRSRWENLDRGQYPFQPIKFVNLVVPSPCETEPYNNVNYTNQHPSVEETLFQTISLSKTSDAIFSAECTIGMVWGLTAHKHYGTKV